MVSRGLKQCLVHQKDKKLTLAQESREEHHCSSAANVICFLHAEPINRARHIKICHSGVSPYVCKTCGKDFNRIDTLKSHQRVHRNIS